MNDFESRRYQMFTRVLNFGAMHADSFPSSSFGGELFAELGKIITEFTESAMSQQNGHITAKQGTTNKASLRARLHDSLKAISRTARSIAVNKSGIEDTFRLSRKLNNQQLLNTARIFAENAAPFAQDFVRREMPKDFLEQLANNIALFDAAIADQHQGTTTQVTATAAIDDVIERGMSVVNQLDTIIRNKFVNDPSSLAGWISARHTERSPAPAPVQDTPAAAGGN